MIEGIGRKAALRGLAALAAAVLGLTLLGPVSPARAQGVNLLDPQDPCVVEADRAPFADRDEISRTHVLSVDCTFELGISRGRMEGGRRVFNPDQSTRRDMMATFIVQTLEAAGYTLPEASDQGFNDIEGNAHADNINRLAAAGIVEGRSKTRYAPAQRVRRDQMATFLLNAATFAYDGTEFEAERAPGFVDVAPTNVHRDNIFAAYDLFGLVQGRSDTQYNPAQRTPREQMATFLTRLIDITYNR
jgi:hypothetical protein